MKNNITDIDQICRDLYDGTNFPGTWHGFDWWGKASDFHEHAFIIWNIIKDVFDISKPLNIVETGRCSGSSTMLFSAIACHTKGSFISFDISDWNRNHIESVNSNYGLDPQYYKYVIDDSAAAGKYLDESHKIDILFLDSLHSYDQIKMETLLFEKYLNDKSIIFFHDTVWTFDTVMGWIHDYLVNKSVIYAKHPNTHSRQCEYCERFNKPGLMHGRPEMLESTARPNFQSPYDKIELSPHYQKLTTDFIKWSDKTFIEAINSDPLVFTNVEACCGVGILVRNS